MDPTIQAITYTVARKRNPNIWINESPIWMMMDKPAEQAGSRIQVPMRFSQHPVEYFIGAEESEAARQDWERAAFYDWVSGRAPMFYTLDDEIQNDGGTNAIVGYVKSLMQNSDESFADDLEKKFLGNGTDATRRQMNSFQHLANDSANTLGTGTTLGGLDKATLADADGNLIYSGTVIDVGGTGGLTAGNLIRGIARIKSGLTKRGKLAVMHDRVLGHLIAMQAAGSGALSRYVNTGKLDIGFIEWQVEGIPIYPTRNMPFSTSTAATNKAYVIDTETTKVIVRKGKYMVTRPWEKIPKTEAWYAARIVVGNTVCDDPARNGVFTNFVWNATADA